MTSTMFAAYRLHDDVEPRFFPLEQSTDSSAIITDRAYDLGVRMGKGDRMRQIVYLSDDTALIHFGTLIRFLDTPAGDIDAYYAIGATEDEKDALIRMAEIATIDPTFLSEMWDYRKPIKRDGKTTPRQTHLSIALVTDLLSPGRYAATAIDSEVTL